MKTTRSKELFKRAKELTPGGVHSPVRAFKSVNQEPFIVDSAEGAYLTDVDGNRYIDYVGSWGPMVLGHAYPAVVQAISEQAQRGTSYGACCEQELRLTELLVKLMPNIEMLRFVNSGTEATMSALRLARAFTGRNKIVKLTGCYHGHSDHLLVKAGSGVLTLGIPGSPGVPESLTSDTLTAPINDISSVELLFNQFDKQIAAIIIEPIVGNCGFIRPKDGYLEKLSALCSDAGVLLIFDEVMTGFRVHPGGAQGLYGIKPDLTCLGKVIGGGLPVGAYGGRKDIMSMIAPLGDVYQAGTLSGNPLAMVAGLKTLEEWTKPGVFDETKQATNDLIKAFLKSAEEFDIPLVADAEGAMFGYSFQADSVCNFEDAARADLERFNKFFEIALTRGLYFAPSAFEAGFVSHAHIGEPMESTIDILHGVFEQL